MSPLLLFCPPWETHRFWYFQWILSWCPLSLPPSGQICAVNGLTLPSVSEAQMEAACGKRTVPQCHCTLWKTERWTGRYTQNTQCKKWRLSSFFFHSSTSIGSAISPLKNWLKCRLMQSWAAMARNLWSKCQWKRNEQHLKSEEVVLSGGRLWPD